MVANWEQLASMAVQQQPQQDWRKMNTQVYLNMGTLDAPALKLAARFELAPEMVKTQTLVSTTGVRWNVPVDALEFVFEQLNVGGVITPAEWWTIQYRHDGHRNMGVGDVVVVGRNAFTCRPEGWQVTDTEKLLDGISRYRDIMDEKVVV